MRKQLNQLPTWLSLLCLLLPSLACFNGQLFTTPDGKCQVNFPSREIFYLPQKVGLFSATDSCEVWGCQAGDTAYTLSIYKFPQELLSSIGGNEPMSLKYNLEYYAKARGCRLLNEHTLTVQSYNAYQVTTSKDNSGLYCILRLVAADDYRYTLTVAQHSPQFNQAAVDRFFSSLSLISESGRVNAKKVT